MGSAQADLEYHIASEADLLIEWNVPGRRSTDDVNPAILRDLKIQSMASQHIAVEAQLGVHGLGRDSEMDELGGSLDGRS
jgi:hypothetical protein